MFSWGVEAASGQEIFADDHPFASCGVSRWETTTVDEDSRATPFYLGGLMFGSPFRLAIRIS